MEQPRLQLRVATCLLLVACVALNIWLFRLSVLLGLVALNLSKHLVIAYLCQVLGVDRKGAQASRRPAPLDPARATVP